MKVYIYNIFELLKFVGIAINFGEFDVSLPVLD